MDSSWNFNGGGLVQRFENCCIAVYQFVSWNIVLFGEVLGLHTQTADSKMESSFSSALLWSVTSKYELSGFLLERSYSYRADLNQARFE